MRRICSHKISTINLIILKNGYVEKISSFKYNSDGEKQAEEEFIEECSKLIPNWSEYTEEDVTAVLNSFQCKRSFGSDGVIYLVCS